MTAKVLVFEADSFLRITLCMWLETALPTCDVIEVTTAEESVALTKSHSPRIILLDGSHLGAQSSAMISSLKALSPGTQIVLLTDFDYEILRTEALAAGAAACVSKFCLLKDLQPILPGLLTANHQNGHTGGDH